MCIHLLWILWTSVPSPAFLQHESNSRCRKGGLEEVSIYPFIFIDFTTYVQLIRKVEFSSFAYSAQSRVPFIYSYHSIQSPFLKTSPFVSLFSFVKNFERENDLRQQCKQLTSICPLCSSVLDNTSVWPIRRPPALLKWVKGKTFFF